MSLLFVPKSLGCRPNRAPHRLHPGMESQRLVVGPETEVRGRRIEPQPGLRGGAGGLYHHFSSKEEMLVEGVRRHLDRLDALPVKKLEKGVGRLWAARALLETDVDDGAGIALVDGDGYLAPDGPTTRVHRNEWARRSGRWLVMAYRSGCYRACRHSPCECENHCDWHAYSSRNEGRTYRPLARIGGAILRSTWPGLVVLLATMERAAAHVGSRGHRGRGTADPRSGWQHDGR